MIGVAVLGSTGSIGENTLDVLARHPDLAGIRLLHARQDADQSRLAGTVLAQQRVDLARMEIQADIVIGQHARKALGDSAQ